MAEAPAEKDFVTSDVEFECEEAFKCGDHKKAVQLLPCVRQPKAVTTSFKLRVGIHLVLATLVSLLHLGAYHGWLDVVVDLVNKYHYHPECPDSLRQTPLHYATHAGHLEVVTYLVTEKHCNPMCKEGRLDMTPLHYACEFGHLRVIKYLVDECGCNPTCQDTYGYMPIHYACETGHLPVVHYLITEQQCDPHAPDSRGEAPIHYACVSGDISVVRYLVNDHHCDLTAVSNSARTPLHCACLYGRTNVARYLFAEHSCDLTCQTDTKQTPLHLACRRGHTSTVQFLLSSGKVNPKCTDIWERTPLDYATGNTNCYKLLRLFETFSHCILHDFPVHSFTKVILTGNSGAGKSCLAQAIIHIASRSTTGTVDKVTSRHVKVESFTAGIIPIHIQSEMIGNIVLYDIAGQPEYHCCHSAVMENIMQASPAVFVNMVDLSKRDEEICHELHYWFSFIENTCNRVEEKSCVILVGSHADLLSHTQLKNQIIFVSELVQNRAKKQEFVGFIATDCRIVDSSGTSHLISLLSKTKQIINARTPVMSFHCHLLYAFLHSNLKKPACKLEELTSRLAAEKNSSLPHDTPGLAPLLDSLSDKGLILFLQNRERPCNSWVVGRKEFLLKDVNGTLFAPKQFPQHCQIASNTGLVPVSSLHELFPHYEVEMLVGFLERLQFCQPLDSSTLGDIVTNLKFNSERGKEHLFFPGLIEEKKQGNHFKGKEVNFGWCLGCKEPHQFFTNRFLHVLLLRLAFTFSLASKHLPSSCKLSGLQRRCEVWTNGLYWRDISGVSTLVEVIEQNRWVVVLMYQSQGASSIHSAVIRMILDLWQEFCCDIEVSECLISPALLSSYPFTTLPDTELYDMGDVARSMLLHAKEVLDRKSGTNSISSEKLLHSEPYYTLSPSSIFQLFDSKQSNEPVSPALLQEVQSIYQLPNPTPQDCKHLREYLDQMSMFRGRNPLVSYV